MKILYFDCYAGISGDMTVGALLDLGVPFDLLQDELTRLAIPRSSYALSLEKTSRHGVQASKFSVSVHGKQHHRHYADIAAMIAASALPEQARQTAGKILLRLAEAEAKVHGVEIDRVHFHEVGGIDSIMDIVGTAICLHYLKVGTAFIAPLPLGGGFVDTAHGRLPVPAPATAELLRGLPVHGELGTGERVTPTGAAIVAALANSCNRPDGFTVEAVGCGAGDRDFPDVPNILRVFLGEKGSPPRGDDIRVMEAHIDDMNPEILGFLMDRLLSAGALDVTFSPVQMKKNRPGTRLTVICPAEQLHALARLVLTETTTIGVRHYAAQRLKLEWDIEERSTSLGTVRVKVIRDGNTVVRIAPEFEECRRIAEEQGILLQNVYRTIEKETSAP